MPKYKDVEPILAKLEEFAQSTCDSSYEDGIRIAMQVVNEKPVAEMQEVKHAHWVKNEAGYYECSNCESLKPYDGIAILKPEWATYWECDYCRYCGAKMDEKENDE